MGNTVYPSASVFKSINDFYGCDRKCLSRRAVCLNNGYPNPNNCDSCNCPEGFGGRHCEARPPPSGTDCGRDFEANREWQTINETLIRDIGKSPYPFYCYYHIKVTLNFIECLYHRILFRLLRMRLSCLN